MELTVTLTPEQLAKLARQVAQLLAPAAGDDDGFLDVAGAAEFLACPKSRIYALVSAGRLPVSRDGSRLLFDGQALRAYVAGGGAERP